MNLFSLRFVYLEKNLKKDKSAYKYNNKRVRQYEALQSKQTNDKNKSDKNKNDQN